MMLDTLPLFRADVVSVLLRMVCMVRFELVKVEGIDGVLSHVSHLLQGHRLQERLGNRAWHFQGHLHCQRRLAHEHWFHEALELAEVDCRAHLLRPLLEGAELEEQRDVAFDNPLCLIVRDKVEEPFHCFPLDAQKPRDSDAQRHTAQPEARLLDLTKVDLPAGDDRADLEAIDVNLALREVLELVEVDDHEDVLAVNFWQADCEVELCR